MEIDKDLQQALDKVSSEVKDAVKVEVKNATEGLLKPADLKAKLEEMGLKSEEIKTLSDAVAKQGEAINLLNSKKDETPKTFQGFLKGIMPQITKSKESKQKMLFEIPLVRKTITVNSSITSDGGGFMIPGFEDYPLPPIGLQAAFTLITLPADHHGIIRYTYQSTNTQNGGMTAEGSAPTADVHAWTSAYETVEKCIAIEKISYEALTDVVDMEATMRRLISNTLWQKREAQLYNGNGSAPNIHGLYSSSTLFPYSSWTGITTGKANVFDLAMLMGSEINRLYGGKFMPNTVCMNPTDLLGGRWEKDSDGQYIINPFTTPDGRQIGAMKVIESPAITAGTMMVGDSRFAYLYLADNIEIEIGYNDDDFKSDLVTIKGRHRICTKISPDDALGWYYVDSIANACAALTTVSH